MILTISRFDGPFNNFYRAIKREGRARKEVRNVHLSIRSARSSASMIARKDVRKKSDTHSMHHLNHFVLSCLKKDKKKAK